MAPPAGRGAAGAVANQSGLALIIVLAVVALLTITVTEFTYSVQIDQHRTRNALHALQSQLLARSGVNLAEGFLMLDDEPGYDAYTEEWWLRLREFCDGLELEPSMLIRCRVRDESGKININNTKAPIRRVESQAVTGDAILRDAMRCMFEGIGVEVDIVDKLADHWQQEPPQTEDGKPAPIPEFTSLEDFGATFGIPGEQLHKLRNVLTAQPSRLLPNININTATGGVLTAVLNAESPGCAGDAPIEDILTRQVDLEQPFRNSGDINTVIQGVENVDLKRRLFGVRSRLYRLEASALTNVDPTEPSRGGIGQTLSVLVSRQQGGRLPQGVEPQIGPNGKPIPNWTLRPLDWQKEGGARLFRSNPEDDQNLPGNPDDEEEPEDDADV
jgi:type II secretory pathway component PulK